MTNFNSDLLRNKTDLKFLRSQFPDIADGVQWDHLGSAFDTHEEIAMADKATSSNRINLGIALIVLSLLITLISTAPIVRTAFGIGLQFTSLIALAALVLLVVGALLSRGVISGKRRDDWLRHRMIAERLRQLNFQFLAANVDLLCKRGTREAEELERRKAKVLEAFKFEVEQSSYLQAIVDDESLSRGLTVDIGDVALGDLDPVRWGQFLRYYETLRLGWQEQYARAFFDAGGSPFRKRASSFDRFHALKTVEFFATIMLLLLQSLAVLTQLVEPASIGLTQLFVLGASISAVIIFGTNAVRDTSAVAGELTRYRHYLTHIAKARRFFSESNGAADATRVLAGIREMEEAAYFEMREFILLRKRVDMSL